jgi:hypothetical protein
LFFNKVLKYGEYKPLTIRAMKSLNFESLSVEERALLILSDGKFVSKSMFKNVEISLFRIEDHFLEVWYEPAIEKVTKVLPLSKHDFDPYLKHLEIALN